MGKILVGAAVHAQGSHAIRAYLEALAKAEGKFDVLFTDYSPDSRYASWLRDAQRILRVQVDHMEFRDDVGLHERRAQCHNALRDACLSGNYDALLLLGQDIVLPPEGLRLLVESRKKVVCGITHNLYPMHGRVVKLPSLFGPYGKEQQQELLANKDTLREMNPALYAALEKSSWDFSGVKRQLAPEEVTPGHGLLPIKSTSFDCLFIHKDILRDVTFSSENGTRPDDVSFFLELKRRRISCFANTDVQCARKVPKSYVDAITRVYAKNSQPAAAG